MPLKARLIREIGTIAFLRVYWGGSDCPNCHGGGKPGWHDAKIEIAKTDAIRDWKLGGELSDYPDDRWPSKCDHCDARARIEHGNLTTPNNQINRQVFRRTLYNTDSGQPEPGDLYWTTHHHSEESGCVLHDNCDGRHLFAICPDGSQWNIDGRASNCTLPKDRLHRCWVRSGEPPNVTVGKGGNTCSAGGGSIAVPGYHGFLKDGCFTP